MSRQARYAIAIAGAAALALYAAVLRPRARFWGTTKSEVEQPLPDASAVEFPRYQSRRAITIDAPTDEVWQWLVQIGQRRGGFYTYDWLENLFGLDIHSANEIRPELQGLTIGDFVAAEPKHTVGWTVTSLDAPTSLVLRVSGLEMPSADHGDRRVFKEMPATWTFVINPIGETSCRLVADFRADLGSGVMPAVLSHAILEPAHFIMERGMLLGIKQRAESHYAEMQQQPLAA